MRTVRLLDVFVMLKGQRQDRYADYRWKGPTYAYAVPRGPAVSIDGHNWELCQAPERDDPE